MELEGGGKIKAEKRASKKQNGYEIKDYLEALIIAMAGLVVIGIVDPSIISIYHNIPHLDMIHYFDIFVRGGIFKFILLPTVLLLSYWIGREKLRLSWKNSLIFMAYGFFAFYFIFYVGMPYYFYPTGNYHLIPIPGTMPAINESASTPCESIDFFYSPTDERSLRQKEVIDSVSNKIISIPIRKNCIEKHFNDRLLCINEFGKEAYENSESLAIKRDIRKEKGDSGYYAEYDVSVPAIVIGCNATITDGLINEENLMSLVCERFGVCDA